MFTLENLADLIAERAGAAAAESYTRSLLDRGAAHCARKFGEEAVAVRSEAADALYHLLVALAARGVGVADVMAELEARTARSGHAEKAARPA
jgi:phosphoribosyl-ATP pyrophosphohydrolase